MSDDKQSFTLDCQHPHCFSYCCFTDNKSLVTYGWKIFSESNYSRGSPVIGVLFCSLSPVPANVRLFHNLQVQMHRITPLSLRPFHQGVYFGLCSLILFHMPLGFLFSSNSLIPYLMMISPLSLFFFFISPVFFLKMMMSN